MTCAVARRVARGMFASLAALAGCPLIFAQALPSAAPGLRADAPIDVNRPYDQELRSSAAPDLVIAVGGSLIIDSNVAALPSWDPKVIELLNGKAFPASTTVAVADLQTTFIEPASFGGYPYAWDGVGAYAAPATVALELKSRGVAMLARANSHALDWGIEGMRATGAALDAAGVKHAGTGEREGLARMASFLEEPSGKGRVALLSTATHFRPTTNALSSHGAAPGRPGISAIELLPLRLVPAQERAQLQGMACRFQYPDDPPHCTPPEAPRATVSLFGSRFASGASASEDYSSDYEINQAHIANELRSVREAKQNSDLVVLSISTGPWEASGPSAATTPRALILLAHAMIGAGADLVMSTGATELGGIEIYRFSGGPPRPILYGLGRLSYTPDAVPRSERPEDGDSLIVRSGIDGARVTLEIYPIDLRAAGGPIGVPKLADTARGREILERLQRLSAPFHTVIRTEAYGSTVRGVIVADQSAGFGGSERP